MEDLGLNGVFPSPDQTHAVWSHLMLHALPLPLCSTATALLAREDEEDEKGVCTMSGSIGDFIVSPASLKPFGATTGE